MSISFGVLFALWAISSTLGLLAILSLTARIRVLETSAFPWIKEEAVEEDNARWNPRKKYWQPSRSSHPNSPGTKGMVS